MTFPKLGRPAFGVYCGRCGEIIGAGEYFFSDSSGDFCAECCEALLGESPLKIRAECCGFQVNYII